MDGVDCPSRPEDSTSEHDSVGRSSLYHFDSKGEAAPRPAVLADDLAEPRTSRDDGDITRLLRFWQAGEPGAEERLFSLVYGELYKIAVGCFAIERRGHTLQPTALVNEAYLRLVSQRRVTWRNRSHFFGIAARVVRRVLVDHARRHLAVKREPGVRVALAQVDDLVSERPELLVALDGALAALAKHDPLGARVIELRFFAGLTGREAAEVLSTSPATVKRRWRTGRAWLFRELSQEAEGGL